MTSERNRFWCKVLFAEFIRHFRKLSDEEIVRDVRQSMDDLEALADDTDTFGSQMVRWSNGRAELPPAIASRENGRKGGRPRKRLSGPMPEDKRTVYDFAEAEGLDTGDAYECWDCTVNERDGKTLDGEPVADWKAYVKAWCSTRKGNRGKKNGIQG